MITTTPLMTTEKKPVVCVFCGASEGTSPIHMEAARKLAHALHEHGMNLVYGGGTSGLMGEVARTLVSLSGLESVHGIIPAPLVQFEREGDTADPKKHEIDEATYGRTTIVKDMHTRKKMMAQEVMNGGPGGGFVALSGGYGTFEELMEVTTWNQLGIHDKPVVVYNVEDIWTPLLQWIQRAAGTGFVSTENVGIIQEATQPAAVMQKLRTYQNAPGRFKLTWDDD